MKKRSDANTARWL